MWTHWHISAISCCWYHSSQPECPGCTLTTVLSNHWTVWISASVSLELSAYLINYIVVQYFWNAYLFCCSWFVCFWSLDCFGVIFWERILCSSGWCWIHCMPRLALKYLTYLLSAGILGMYQKMWLIWVPGLFNFALKLYNLILSIHKNI